MAGRPRLLPLLLKEQLKLSLERKVVSLISSEASTGVAGHVFKFALIIVLLSARSPPFSHFDPFGTELYVSRGGATIRGISEFGFRNSELNPSKSDDTPIRNPQFEFRNLQRSFQLSTQFLAATRQSRFHSPDVNSQRFGNFFIGESFDIPQYHRLPVCMT